MLYNIFINIVAWIAIVLFLLLLFLHIFILIYYKLTDDVKYVGIRRTSYLFTTYYEEIYILPAISLNLVAQYKSISFMWLKYTFTLSYHIFTDKEENEEAEFRLKVKEENES